jgi:predicted O-methyltransferase YrrM
LAASRRLTFTDGLETMGLLHRIIRGDNLHKTRLHNCAGELIDWRGLCYLPHSLFSAFLRKAFRYHQVVPWLGYRAIRHLDGLIGQDWKVLEFGSGMSSLWFAQRCKLLVSIETDPAWYEKVTALLARRGITNIDYRLQNDSKPLTLDEHPDHSFEFALVDGTARYPEAMLATQKVRPGGYIYLDNCDTPWEDHQRAREHLLAMEPAAVRYFTDLCPFQVSVQQGMLVQTRADPDAAAPS